MPIKDILKKGGHNTCTSSNVASQLGYDKEYLPVDALNELFRELYGYNVSDDPALARLQREQAIAKANAKKFLKK